MMDMMSPGVAAAVLVALLMVAVAAYLAIRVLGARSVEGDHVGERGYESVDRDPGPRP